MEVRVCKNCRRLFKYIYGPELCQNCRNLTSQEEKEFTASLQPAVREDEEKYTQVRDYILAHPKAMIIEIAEENDISPIKLLEWVRQERFEFSEDSEFAWFECKNCGTKIKSGVLCNQCKIAL